MLAGNCYGQLEMLRNYWQANSAKDFQRNFANLEYCEILTNAILTYKVSKMFVCKNYK